MSTEQPRTAVSVRVNPEVDAMIAYGAHFLGLTKKELVARALRDYLAARLEALVAQPSGQSYADLIAEWQAEHGAFTEDEMAAARAELIAADEEAARLVTDLRDASRTPGLLETMWQWLADNALLNREDLAESLEQLRRGEGREIDPTELRE